MSSTVPTNAPTETQPTTAYHWVMTVQTSDGRQGTNDGRISVTPGLHTQASTYTAIRKVMQGWIGTDNFTVVFFRVEPNQL